MTTTPEQLQAWREEFEAIYDKPALAERREGVYLLGVTQLTWEGYRRAKQETEQLNEGILFLAKFAAQTIASSGHAASHYPAVQIAIKELLK